MDRKENWEREGKKGEMKRNAETGSENGKGI